MQNIFLLIRQKCSKKMAFTWGQVAYYIIVCVTTTTHFEPRSFDYFISMKFLIVLFLPVSPFTPTSPFINFEDLCQPPRLLHPLCLLFWPKFASLPVYFALPLYLKLESIYKFEGNGYVNWFHILVSHPCKIDRPM